MRNVGAAAVAAAAESWSTVPVILLSAFDTGPRIDRALALGVKRVFLKANFSPPDLLACVHELRRGNGSNGGQSTG